jgi:putative hydrolase of the HAD superfamily
MGARLGPLTRNAVLLDALGTLVRLEPPAPRLRRELLERFGLSLTGAEAERAIAKEIAYYRAHLDEGRDEPSLRALRRRCAEVLWGELAEAQCGEVARARPGGDVPTADAIVAALLASLSFSAFTDVAPTLSALRQRGLRVVVVSNWDVSLSDVLARLDLVRWLDGVVTSAAVGARKPRSEIFECGLELAGVGPEHAIHVGDSVEEDVAGARAAGIEAVLLAREQERRLAGAEDSDDTNEATRQVTTIRTLRELPGLLSAHG